MPSLRWSGFQSISPPAPQISRPLAASRGPGIKSSSIAFLSQTSILCKLPPLRGRVAAFERQPGIARGQDRDVFDRILDVEIGEIGDVEVGRVEVRLDQSRHDGPAAGVDPLGILGRPPAPLSRPGISDSAVLHDDDGVGNGRSARPVHELAVGDQGLALCGPHRESLTQNCWSLDKSRPDAQAAGEVDRY